MCPWSSLSLGPAIEDRQQIIQRLIDPPEVTDVTPVNGVRAVAEVVVGQLPQGLDLVEDNRQALEVGIESGRLDGYGRLRVN